MRRKETFREWLARVGQKIEPCPRCHEDAIIVHPESGGLGSGDMTSYAAFCKHCGHSIDCLGSDGSLRSAVRHWNKIARSSRSEGVACHSNSL